MGSIGLLPYGAAWEEQPFADEYDDYLRKVEGDLRNGLGVAEVVAYLVRIEREHMGLGVRPGQDARAEATVRAVQRLVSGSA